MNTAQHTLHETRFEQCLKCTVCTVYCPVAKANPLYPAQNNAGQMVKGSA